MDRIINVYSSLSVKYHNQDYVVVFLTLSVPFLLHTIQSTVCKTKKKYPIGNLIKGSYNHYEVVPFLAFFTYVGSLSVRQP